MCSALAAPAPCELLEVEDRVDLRMATFSKSLASCGGVIAGPADVIEFLRIASRSFIFTASGVPAAIGATLAAVRICRSDEGRELFARVLDNARYLHDGLCARASTSSGRPDSSDGTEIDHAGGPGRRRRRLEGRRSCGRSLYEAGVFVNIAIHPAVPPGGALLRNSVMATHDRGHARPRADDLRRVKREFEAEHGPLPAG